VATESFGERLRRLRTERGLSQRDVSGPRCSYAYVSRLEAGERYPSVRAIRYLAARLEVDPHYLETGVENPLVVALRDIAEGRARSPQRRATEALRAHDAAWKRVVGDVS
jgi:transcriptional regulator with XRE-family HTH domain